MTDDQIARDAGTGRFVKDEYAEQNPTTTVHQTVHRDVATWDEILAARAAAHAKHGDNSIEALAADDRRWLAVLVEEVGEVAHELTYDAAPAETSISDPFARQVAAARRVRGELVDVLAVASAWLSACDRVIDAKNALAAVEVGP